MADKSKKSYETTDGVLQIGLNHLLHDLSSPITKSFYYLSVSKWSMKKNLNSRTTDFILKKVKDRYIIDGNSRNYNNFIAYDR